MIGGEGNGSQFVESLIDKFELNNNVTMLGGLTRSQMAQHMAECDIFVLPSRYETFGVVYAEAMACGKPVIGTKTGGPDSFVTEEAGILVDVENKEQLAEAMISMIENYDKYDSAAIRKIIVDNFSMKAIADKLEEIYKEVLKC